MNFLCIFIHHNDQGKPASPWNNKYGTRNMSPLEKKGKIMVTRVKSCDNLADVFTKVVTPPIF
jgi:hypothetical protein